jgi:hypothetical protein
MLFLFDKIMRIAYGQEEIDIGIESEGNTEMQNSEGSEPSVGEDTSESISSSSSIGTITGLGNYLDSIIFSIIVVSVAVATYFIMRFFINRYADSLNLDRRQLAGSEFHNKNGPYRDNDSHINIPFFFFKRCSSRSN